MNNEIINHIKNVFYTNKYNSMFYLIVALSTSFIVLSFTEHRFFALLACVYLMYQNIPMNHKYKYFGSRKVNNDDFVDENMKLVTGWRRREEYIFSLLFVSPPLLVFMCGGIIVLLFNMNSIDQHDSILYLEKLMGLFSEHIPAVDVYKGQLSLNGYTWRIRIVTFVVSFSWFVSLIITLPYLCAGIFLSFKILTNTEFVIEYIKLTKNRTGLEPIKLLYLFMFVSILFTSISSWFLFGNPISFERGRFAWNLMHVSDVSLLFVTSVGFSVSGVFGLFPSWALLYVYLRNVNNLDAGSDNEGHKT